MIKQLEKKGEYDLISFVFDDCKIADTNETEYICSGQDKSYCMVKLFLKICIS